MKKMNIQIDARSLRAVFFSALNSKANILICPAMGITSKYYEHFASWLSEQGYSVIVLDYQGTGISGSEEIKEIDINLFDWSKNIEAAGKWFKQKKPNTPIFFLGHSIGSQLFGFIEEIKLFDKAIFISSSTGYWKDGHWPKKWVNLLLLYIVLPLSVWIWGFANARLFGQGENYPKGAALHWRKWCLHKHYLNIDLNTEDQNNFNLFNAQVSSIWFSDDPIANKITAPKLVSLYKKALVRLIEIHPQDCEVKKIGHIGFLSRKMKDNLWIKVLAEFNNNSPSAELSKFSKLTEKNSKAII